LGVFQGPMEAMSTSYAPLMDDSENLL